MWSVALLMIAAIAAPKIFAPQGEKSGKAHADGGPGGRSSTPLRVSTFIVQPQPFAETISSTGTLRAEEGVELQAETDGKIVAINFTEGSRVRGGELLVKLNDADLRATLARATYLKELAELRERRLSQLLAQRMVTQNDYETAQSEVRVQEAAIALTQAQIAKTEIRAPFDGIVGLRYVSTGAYVNAATRIATLQRVDKLKIDFAVPEKYAGRIKLGSPISFRVAGGDANFKGEIYAFDPRIDSGTRTVLLRAVCRNELGRLLPGAFARVDLTLSELPSALLIPAEAVIPGLEEKNVFIINDGKAERRTVETGTRTTTKVQVLAGLASGDVLITSGLQQMRAGQPVRPLDAQIKEPAPDRERQGTMQLVPSHAREANASSGVATAASAP